MSEATSASASSVAGVLSQLDLFKQEDVSEPGELTKSFYFSSGNPRIEETRGVMLLFREEIVSSASDLPSERKPLLCVLGVPNHMTYADFCLFCGSFIHHILEMRIVRNDGMEESYSVLIRFDEQSSTDNFYRHFSGKRFSSLEAEICRVLFTMDVQFTGSIEHAQASPVGSMEQPSCPVCLERLDQDMGGTLTTICNHSFHCSCISKWTDSSCPVCRYCQQQPEKSICFVCQTSENLWMCIICGYIGCGSYREGHAIRHWKETEHCYSLELETRRVWDYAGNNYVHRLIQSKTDGKLIELNHHCTRANDRCGSCECSVEPGFGDALLNNKVDAIVNEYNELLTVQLENQKQYFEKLIEDVDEETRKEVSEAVEKALSQNPKLLKLQTKLDKCAEEKKFHDYINENLVRNLETWHAKITEYEERQQTTLKLKDKRIEELEEKLRNLMTCLENGTATEPSLPTDESAESSTVLPAESSSKTKGKEATNKRRNRRG